MNALIMLRMFKKKYALETKLLNKENKILENKYENSILQLKENEQKNKNLLIQINELKQPNKEKAKTERIHLSMQTSQIMKD